MTKEELLEMVNATISGNGKQEITGLSLNLALTEIINAMGTGDSSGGGLMLHFVPSENFFGGDWVLSTDSQSLEIYEECVKHNQKIYNILLECNTEHKPVPGPIYFDNTFFEWGHNKRENSVRGGLATAWRALLDRNGNLLFSFISLANGNTDYISLGMDGLIYSDNE